MSGIRFPDIVSGLRPFAAALALSVIGLGSGHAVERVQIALGHIEGERWEAGSASLSVGLTEVGRLTWDFLAEDVKLPSPLGRLKTLSVHCADATLTLGTVSCASGRLQLTAQSPSAQPLQVGLAFEYTDGVGKVRLGNLADAPGTVELDMIRGAEGWQVTLQGHQLSLAHAGRAFSQVYGPLPIALERGNLSLQGTLNGSDGIASAVVETTIDGLSFSDQAGFHAGENIGVEMHLSARKRASAWRFDGRLSWKAGEAYLEPIYLQVPREPVTLTLKGTWRDGEQILELTDFRVSHQDLGTTSGTLRVAVDEVVGLQQLRLKVPRAQLKAVYEILLQPFVAGSALDDLEVGGEITLDLNWPHKAPGRASLHVHNLSLDDRKGRFGVDALNGQANWVQSGSADETQLNWDYAYLYRVDLGAGNFSGKFEGRRLRLNAPLTVPIMDGSLEIDHLDVVGIGSPDLAWQWKGSLQPVSMDRLSIALGWPSMRGTLSGLIPAVRYRGGEINVDGALSLQAFDGSFDIRNVRLVQPFGVVPVLSADVDIANISLDSLTSAFSFGNIQGRLSGYIHNLILEDWKPRSFDAEFATPSGDRSRHRISQRAVDNLAKLGGSGGIVSRTFLRFFEQFSYDRLGISCRLRNQICAMDGIGPAEDGFYIVKGGGMPPRIDVLGYNRQVDWKTLVERLKNITRAKAPIIQ